MNAEREIVLIVSVGLLAYALIYHRTTTAKDVLPADETNKDGQARSPLLVNNGGKFDCAIVGESNYQQHLSSASEEASPLFSVEREPSNAYDRNAVVIKHKGRTVGYLAREEAEQVAAIIDSLERGGQVVTCFGRIKGGGPGRSFGVWLDLPAKIVPDNQSD